MNRSAISLLWEECISRRKAADEKIRKRTI
jgi:hypothetical protein